MANVCIEKRVKEIIADHLGLTESEVKPEVTFDNLGCDSLDTIEIIMALEKEYELEICDEEVEKLQTVQDAIDYVGQFSR